MSTHKCHFCGHMPHSERSCRVEKVSGPPSTAGVAVGDSYVHVGREVTTCGCTDYLPTLNGHVNG